MSLPVRTNLRRAIKTCLQEITTAGGYYNTIRRVYDPPMNLNQMNEFPCVNILFGRADRADSRKAGNDFLIDIRQVVVLDVFLSTQNDAPLSQDYIIADIQKYFGNNYYIQPQGGARTCFECMYLSDEAFGTEETTPNCGVTFELEVFYSIRRTDPTLMV